MTQHDDLDRVLGDWLEEGPVRSPEPVLANAVQHARSHPRRPDPLAFLRSDPMRGRTSLFGVAPVPLLAVLGLLLAAAVGVALVGGQRGDPAPSVLPVPTAGPSDGPSAAPSASPSPQELPSPSFPIRVGLRTASAATMFVDVTDESGLLVDARTGTPVEGGSVPNGVSATNVDDRTVLLAWTDAVCDITYGLKIRTTMSMTLTSPPCVGDTFALDRRLLLQFAVPVPAADIEIGIEVVPAGEGQSPSAELPVVGAVAVPGGTVPMTVTLRGDPAVVTGIRAATSEEVAAAPGVADADLVAYRRAANELILAWRGGGCDVSATLTVEADLVILVEDPRPACDAIGIGKGVVVTFRAPVDAAARELVLVPGPLDGG